MVLALLYLSTWSFMMMPCIVFKVYSVQKRDGQTDWQTDGQTDGRVDYYMPPFGGIKTPILLTQLNRFDLWDRDNIVYNNFWIILPAFLINR